MTFHKEKIGVYNMITDTKQILRNYENKDTKNNSFRTFSSLIPNAQSMFATSARDDVLDMSEFDKNVKSGAIKINDADPHGWSYLHYAAARDNAEAIEYLLKHGANIEAKTDDERTPLYLSVVLGNLTAIKTLLKFGANVDVRDIDGYHLLTFAERRSQEIKDILDIDAWKKEIDIYANPKFDKLYKLQMTMELKKLKTKYR